MHVPPDAVQRFGVKTLGVELSLEAIVQTSATFAWRFGGLMLPRAEHKESSGGVKSGDKDDSAKLGVWFGGVHTFDRRNQVFWTFKHTVERNVFEGAANTVDPITGLAPEGVSVQQGLSIFQFGYRWGN